MVQSFSLKSYIFSSFLFKGMGNHAEETTLENLTAPKIF